MGPNIHRGLKYITAIIFLTLHVTSSAKTNARPVYEVINEQSKADDRQIKTGKTDLPYGNPLAGNSHTNALLHAHNQQAMFNAERVRQHQAQLQRWTKTPLIDSYMRAYHESQENHQLALEKQQAKVEEKTQAPRQRESAKKTKQLDPVSATKEEGGKEKTRNHRSSGSAAYQHIAPRYRTLHFPSAYNHNPIKPNAVNEMVHSSASKLYTGIVVNAEGSYPKYYPAQDYQSVQNIETLNSLLNKNPGDQLTEFNALINSAKANPNHDKELETPIDLYFYLKDPSSKGSEHYAHISNVRDHTPIKEEVDEGDQSKTIGFREHSNSHASQLDRTASKNIQFINSELTSQILSAGYNPMFQEEHSSKGDVEPEHQALQYSQQVTYNHDVDGINSDLSERYLHHNSGIQHLNDDGVGVSAYDEDNVSNDTNLIKKRYSKYLRRKRSTIQTKQLVSVGNHSLEGTESNVTQVPTAEPLVMLRLVPKNKRFSDFGTFLTTPNFAIGEAIDHNEAYPLTKTPSRNNGATDIFYDETDYGTDDDFATDYDYETSDTVAQRNHFTDTSELYAPSETYIQNVKFNTKFTNQRPVKRIPNLNSKYGPPSSVYGSPHSSSIKSVYDSDYTIPSLTYGPPNPSYGIPQSFPHSVDTTFTPSSPHLPEPVYLLTQTQLAKLVGHHNLNIGHLDIYQLSKSKRPSPYPRRYKKRSPYRNKHLRKNILKLHNLHII